MTQQEVALLMQEIKAFYPAKFSYSTELIAAWHKRLAGVQYWDAINALHKYVDEDTYGKPPALGVMVQKRPAPVWSSIVFDRRHNCALWTPEAGAESFEIPLRWNYSRKAWEDEDGRIYALQSEC